MLRLHILQEYHSLLLLALRAPQPLEQLAEVGRADAEHETVCGKESRARRQRYVRVFLGGNKLFRAGKKQRMVVVPFQQKVFADSHFFGPPPSWGVPVPYRKHYQICLSQLDSG